MPDRKNAPKKSGKKTLVGRPLDQDKDFDVPAIKAKELLAELDKPTPKKEVAKGSLLALQPDTPTVANGRIKVFYDKPHHSKYKDVILIALQITVPLTEKHLKFLPKIIADGFHDINKKGRSRMNFRDLPAQHVTFYLDSNRKEEVLSIPAAKMVSANLALIQQKGEGTARDVVRFAFQLQAEHSKPLETFAALNLANDFWVEMENTQESLWDEEEGD